MDAFYGEIRLFAGNFPPLGWAYCNGQILLIQQYPAVFALIGAMYGGDGRTTFALPNLNGRAPMGAGTGSGLTPRTVSNQAGISSYTMSIAQLPAHSHSVACNTLPSNGTQNDPNNNYFGAGPANRSTGQAVNTRYAAAHDGTGMQPSILTPFGAQTPEAINNMQPSLGFVFIICIDGAVFPSFS